MSETEIGWSERGLQEADSQTDKQWCRRECWVKRTKDRTVQADSDTPTPPSAGMQGGKHGGVGD